MESSSESTSSSSFASTIELDSDEGLILPIRLSWFRRSVADEEEFVDVEHESSDGEHYEDGVIDVENDENNETENIEDMHVDIEDTEDEHVDVESNIAQAPNVILSADSPEPGVENPIIRLENPHFSNDKKKNSSGVSQKRTYEEMQDDDSGQNCPVCLDAWTSVGPHRLCSLKCGHLFGKSCVLRWLSTRTRSACPQCNSKTKKSDIRELYATKLMAVDTGELEELRCKYTKAVEEKREVENLLAVQKELTEYYRKRSEPAAVLAAPAPACSIEMIYYKVVATVKFEENSCRVLSYSPQRDVIVLSQKSPSMLWPGFGVRMLSPVDWTLSSFYHLHKKMIRDLVFHPENTEQLLSVAFDNSIKIFDVVSRTELASIPADVPLWCCSWDKVLPNVFYCGSGRGDVIAYNMHCPTECKKIEEGSGVPVVAVMKSQFHGFILCCRAHSVTAYVKDSPQTWRRQVLEVCSGPFVAMSYDDARGTMVLACRPTEEFHFAFRHASYHITFSNGIVCCEESHVFLAGHTLTRISRPCLLSLADKSYYFTFNESQSEGMVCSADMDSRAFCSVRDFSGECTRFHFPVGNSVADLFREVGNRLNYHPETFELALTLRGEGGFDTIILNDHKDKTVDEAGIHAEPGARHAITLTPLKGVNLKKLDPPEEELTLGASASPTAAGDYSAAAVPPPPPPPLDTYSRLDGHYSNYSSSSSSAIMIQPMSSTIVPYVGLVNQAMTCYLNSLLQALFMTPEFRNAMYLWEYDGSQDDESKSMPYQLQKLFLNLQTSTRSSVETTALTRSFGWDSSEAWQQHDIQELCRVMFDALEQKFKDTVQADLINHLYEGTMTDYVKCLECSTEKRRDDKFLDIPLPVRPFGSSVAYSSVEEALRAFVQPETLDGSNQYFCERCNKKCDAHKGLKFTKFPYLLTLHLKRFDFDYSTLNRIKLNDKVTFPEKINLNSFIPCKTEGESPGEVTEESGVKCDDSSTTDSGSALDDENCANLDVPAISNHVDCQEDDEGIDVENSQESEKNRENASEPGPYIYDLFSIMIHSGSATGGHYYAYIKDFSSGDWFCFNDQSVTRITNEDIRKTYGGGRGYYSGAYSSSTNAYMLMYRQIDPVRNATAMSSEDFPKHILDLLERIKEQKELENRLREKEADMMRIKCYYCPPNQDIHEFKLCVNRDCTLKDATYDAYMRVDFGFAFPLEQCRLVLYDKGRRTIECSFEGKEESTMRELLGNGIKSELLLEYRDKNEEFLVYRPGDINTKVLLVNPQTDEVEYISVHGNLDSPVGEYRAAVAKAINLEPTSVQIFLERYAGSPQVLEGEESMLRDKLSSPSNRVIVVPGPVEDVDKIVERAQHIITIHVAIPEVSQESLEGILRPLPDSSRLAFQGAVPVGEGDVAKPKSIVVEENVPDIRGPSPGHDREREREPSPQPLPDPEDPLTGAHSDQSASEDSSLTDSERTIVGEAPGDNLAQLSPNTSPVGWEHNSSSPENEAIDYKGGVLSSEGDNDTNNYYFRATPYMEGDQKMLRVLVDKRVALGQLKDCLQPFVGVQVDYFKVFRTTNGQESECTRPMETLKNYREEERWTVRLGRALRTGETAGKIYLLNLKNTEQPETFLCEWVIATGAPVSVVKQEILAEVKRKCGLEIPFNRCRLRMKKWKEASRPYLDSDKLEFTSSWDLYLQELDYAEPVSSLTQRLVFIRQWCPSKMELLPFQEIVMDSNLITELKQKISGVSEIPVDNIDFAKGPGPFPCADMTILGIHSDLEWNPDVEYLDGYPLRIQEHGGVIIFRDKGEKLKQLTHEERKELMNHERGKSSSARSAFSQRKERALKIYLDSPAKKREDAEVD